MEIKINRVGRTWNGKFWYHWIEGTITTENETCEFTLRDEITKAVAESERSQERQIIAAKESVKRAMEEMKIRIE